MTADDWLLLAGAAAAQIAAYCALNVVPLSRLGSRAARMRPLARLLLKGSDERVIWAIEATGRRLRGASTCLVRAIVAEIRFASPDRAVHLQIGIRRASGGALESHAWVSEGDRVLIGGPVAPDFVRLAVWERVA